MSGTDRRASSTGARATRERAATRNPLARLVGERRARILETLQTAKTTGETAAATEIALSTASEHLHELALARVVVRFRSGRFVYYVLSETGRWLVDELSLDGRVDGS